MPDSTRVWATNKAMMNVTDETRKRCGESSRASVTAIQPANATAACPDGRPPRSGVPRPVNAFVVITTRIVSTSAISVSSAGASESRSRNCELRSPTCPEDQIADGNGVDRGDQHRSGGDVLGQLRHRVGCGAGNVDRRLDRGVDHLGDEDERDREQEHDELEPADVERQRRHQDAGRDQGSAAACSVASGERG